MKIHWANNKVTIPISLYNKTDTVPKNELIEKHIEKLNETIRSILFLIIPKGNIKISSEDKKGLLVDLKQ